MKNISKRADEYLSDYAGDELVSMTGNAGRAYKMTLANAGAGAKVIAIFPGWSGTKAEFEALTGKAIDGLITDTIADVVKSGSPKPLVDFVEFFRRNPANVKQINMSVQNPLQFENPIEVLEGLSPFGDPASRYISPSQHKDPDQSNDKLVHIKEDLRLQFNDQTAVILAVNAGETVAVTFIVDAIYNSSAILDHSVSQRDSARGFDL